MENQFFLGAFFAYFLASCLYISHLIFRNDNLGKLASGITILGLSTNTLALAARTITTGRLPFASMYEFGMTFVWGIALFYLCIEIRYKNRAAGTFVMPVVFILTGIFALFYQQAHPLMPALKSNWLLAHVLTAIIAYSALALSFALALMYLWRLRINKDNVLDAFPSLETLDVLVNRLITLAVPFLTLLIITGAVWAEYAWGSYWRWDPKETWSLITWIIYAVYLHGRTILGWKGKKAMIWAVSGFVAVMFTFIGVNTILPGLHSYTSFKN
jgi:cytochrome c-type biogenesis protein CcsB